jgi:hypothetical protein
MNWLKRLFGAADATADRVEKAGERLAGAFEDMADDAEQLRDAFRARLGGEPKQIKALVSGKGS